MKKILVVFGVLFLAFISYGLPTNASPTFDPCQRIVLTVLTPNIQAQIEEYYKDKLTVSPIFAPFLGGNSLEIKYFISHIDVNVTVIPYVGPHLDVGKDTIKFRIDNSGKVAVVDYEHIEDYNLPLKWQHIYR